ncbi:MAG: phage head-tail connector protein [Sphingobium limneticum]
MAEPIDLDDAKRQLRVLSNDENTFIESAIVDARGWIEAYTGLILTRREVTEVVPSFARQLRAWPIASIDEIAYVDSDGQSATLGADAYFAQIARRPASLVAKSWPSLACGSMVTVAMTAGFESPEAITAFSPNIMRAMRVLVAGYFRDREGGALAQQSEKYAKGRLRNFRKWQV